MHDIVRARWAEARGEVRITRRRLQRMVPFIGELRAAIKTREPATTRRYAKRSRRRFFEEARENMFSRAFRSTNGSLVRI